MLDNISILTDLSDTGSKIISPESQVNNQDEKTENSYLRCKHNLRVREMSNPLIQWNEKYQKTDMACFFRTVRNTMISKRNYIGKRLGIMFPSSKSLSLVSGKRFKVF